MMAFDSGLAPIVGQQVTLTAANLDRSAPTQESTLRPELSPFDSLTYTCAPPSLGEAAPPASP
jgi:hypothetical protein